MAKVLSGPQSPVHTLLLTKALQRFRTELKDDEGVVLDVDSVEELLSQAKALDPQNARRGKSASSFVRLENILPHISDFAAIVAVCSGADAKATGIVWGSLKVLLMLASPATNTLDAIVDMLDKLSLALPRFRSYEENLPMNEHLESALLEVYTEMTCFCARTINFFRRNPHRTMIQLGWPKVTFDFTQTIKKLETLSRIVDFEAEKIRLRVDTERNTELVAAMEMLRTTEAKKANLPCYIIPFGNQEQFFGRDDLIQSIEESISHEEGQLKSVVLHGMGGVGKTQTALRYVNAHRTKYDAILWISADNPIKMTQSFLEISKRLGLSEDDEDSRDAVVAMAKVKHWLATVSCHWLLVFDNADDPENLVNAWPGGAVGSILITSRDSAAGFGTSAKAYHIHPFNTEEALQVFISLARADNNSETEKAAAEEIVKAFGGLPLAINQVSGFIVQQRLALKDFMPLYERNSAKINARKLKSGDYAYTLSTVWDLSLETLSGASSTLQKMLVFFDPDKIHESVLCDGGSHVQDREFEFLSDEMDFLDAKEELLKRALVERSSESATLTIHRLIQSTIMNKLSVKERTRFFDCAIAILSNGFPNTWNKVTSHQFSTWEKCELCLPHVDFLIKQSKRYSVHATDPLAFAELVLRSCWYLYERERYSDARRFMSTALTCIDDRDSLMFASTTMLQGLIELDTNNIKTALEAFQKSLAIREARMDINDEFIASSLNAISIAYTELGDFKKAIEAGQRAIDIRLHNNSDRIGNSYSNMASTLMRMGEADRAEEMLKRCPSLKEFTDETFLNTGNPRFSGDMVLLARIRQHQGRLDDAIRLSSKALAFRKKLLGSGLKTCDSLYQVATFLQIRGDLSSAINFLEESILIANNIPEGIGYEARSMFKLSQIYAALGDSQRSKSFADSAATKRAAIYASRGEVPQSSNENFEHLVLWMLW